MTRAYSSLMGMLHSLRRSDLVIASGLKSGDTRFLLRPESNFFRFFGNPSGNAAAQGAAATVAPAPKP